jgi:hypothetical protein
MRAGRRRTRSECESAEYKEGVWTAVWYAKELDGAIQNDAFLFLSSLFSTSSAVGGLSGRCERHHQAELGSGVVWGSGLL